MWPNPQFPADLVTFTEEILNEKLYFLCSGISKEYFINIIKSVKILLNHNYNQRYIKNPAKHLKLSFLRKKLVTESRQLFPQKTLS